MCVCVCVRACARNNNDIITYEHSNTGIWVSTKILEVATDDASVKQTWKQVALSTAQFDKTLFLEIARKSLKDSKCDIYY